MAKKQIIIDVPKFPVVRSRFLDERHVALDMRGIRNLHKPMLGRLNPTKGSRPKFISVEQLEGKIGEYWESCNGIIFDNKGQPIRKEDGTFLRGQVCPYTVSGLALYLGVTTEAIKKYKIGKVDRILDEMHADTDDVKTFANVIATAKQRIESYAEKRLYDRDGQKGGQYVLDAAFNWREGYTAAGIEKARAEIEKMRAELELKQREFELKQRLLEEGGDDDQLTINIVRGKKGESE